ncbi:MAG TPA: LacI family DNA-binding transcriptional regulator [Asanoa sp.]
MVVVPVGKRGRATLRDVAERAGVSATTASFVLSGRRDMRISAATEELVLQAARTLEYRRRLVPRTTMRPAPPRSGSSPTSSPPSPSPATCGSDPSPRRPTWATWS